MKVLSAAIALFTSTVVSSAASSSNPFAPKTTTNAANSHYIGSLLRRATPLNSNHRSLEDAYDGQVQVDLSKYSIKFEKCQTIKQYNANGGNNNNGVDTTLATKRFVIFRLCPDNSCSTCNYNYGEYIIDIESYLDATVQHKLQQQENYCESCNQCIEIEAAMAQAAANGQDYEDDSNGMCNSINTSTCYDQCQNIENMSENGYADASEYTTCGKVYENENTGKVYYAGAVCAASGTRIKIALFRDEECSTLDDSVTEMEQYIKNENGYNVKLSYHLLKQTFASGECIASCTEENDNNDQNGEVQVSEVCQSLYEEAGKCESNHGFTTGINANADNYAVQLSNEQSVCEFISTVNAGHYDSTGEIILSGGRTTLSNSAMTTGGQKFALTFFVIGTVGLASYAAYLHQKIVKGSGAELAEQGGAIA